MPRITKTSLNKLQKLTLLDEAKKLGFLDRKKTPKKEELINFILNNKTVEFSDNFENLITSKTFKKSSYTKSKTPDNLTLDSESSFLPLETNVVTNTSNIDNYKNTGAIPKKKKVTFKTNTLSDSRIPSNFSIVTDKSSIKKNIIQEAENCKKIQELIQLLNEFPDAIENETIKKILNKKLNPNLEDETQKREKYINLIEQKLSETTDELEKLKITTGQHDPWNRKVTDLQEAPVKPPIQTSTLSNDEEKLIKNSLIQNNSDVIEENEGELDLSSQIEQQEYDKKQFENDYANSKTEDISNEKRKNFKKNILIEQIKKSEDVADILKIIKNPTDIHLSQIADIDFSLAKTFGYAF
jgi:hypothetical protein